MLPLMMTMMARNVVRKTVTTTRIMAMRNVKAARVARLGLCLGV